MRSPPKRPTPSPAGQSAGLHPRNRHQGRYDFAALTQTSPALSAFLTAGPDGQMTLDFADPDAVRALNRALLATQYAIAHWDIPDGYLCPPVPGRADYLHGLADLLLTCNREQIPRGAIVRALDIGVGANVVYPLVGHREYGWRFVGSEIDTVALRAAHATVEANLLSDAIELRLQHKRGSVFAGIVRSDDRFDITLCNPPFHASADDAARGSRRKWRNLGAVDAARTGATLNFGGQANELWCTGGEASFVRRMIRESAGIQQQVFWFSTLISKSEHLADVHKQLKKGGALDVREITMAQGNKQSRFVAWTYLDPAQREAWRSARWQRAD